MKSITQYAESLIGKQEIRDYAFVSSAGVHWKRTRRLGSPGVITIIWPENLANQITVFHFTSIKAVLYSVTENVTENTTI